VHTKLAGSVVVVFSFTNPTGPNAFEMPTNSDISVALNNARIDGDWGELTEQYGQVYGYRQTQSTDPDEVVAEVEADRPSPMAEPQLPEEDDSDLLVMVGMLVLLVCGIFGAIAVWKMKQMRHTSMDAGQKDEFASIAGGGDNPVSARPGGGARGVERWAPGGTGNSGYSYPGPGPNSGGYWNGGQQQQQQWGGSQASSARRHELTVLRSQHV